MIAQTRRSQKPKTSELPRKANVFEIVKGFTLDIRVNPNHLRHGLGRWHLFAFTRPA